MKTEYKLFSENMLPEAGQLLASRHVANQAKLPLLPTSFEKPSVAIKALQTLWNENFKRGYFAFRNGRLIAYLLGYFIIQPWGRCGYVPLPGYALAEGVSPSVLQDLYALLGEDWVQWGVFSHGIYISAADSDVIDAMFDLGFGKERVDALLDLRTIGIPEKISPAGLDIRRASPADSDHLSSLSGVIAKALSRAPYWHPTVPEDYQELRDGWAELANHQDWTVWLALEGNEAVGTAGFVSRENTDPDMLTAARSVYLSIAAVKPGARRRGISTALTWNGLEQARKDGFETCYTNWISPNLPASRHWPRFGFKEVAYRLSKRIDPQITWTRDSAMI